MQIMNDDHRMEPVLKQIVLIVLGSAFLLLLPLLAMQFTDEVAWNPFDFAVAGVLLIGTGLLYVLAAKMVSNPRYRIALGVAFALALFLVWAELAVGIAGTPFAGT
jgi:hypothetical protein